MRFKIGDTAFVSWLGCEEVEIVKVYPNSDRYKTKTKREGFSLNYTKDKVFGSPDELAKHEIEKLKRKIERLEKEIKKWKTYIDD